MDNVVNIFDKKTDKEEQDDKFSFEDLVQKNKRKEKRLAAMRKSANDQVTMQYNLKRKKP